MKTNFRAAFSVMAGLLVLAGSARAAPHVEETSLTETFTPNIRAGHWSLGGELSYDSQSYSSGPSQSELLISVPVQYFFIDRLAVGPRIRYSSVEIAGKSTSTTRFGVGATYYLFDVGRIIPYVGASLSTRSTSRGNGYRSASADVGVHYFVLPSVAFGPQFYYEHSFETAQVFGSNYYNMAFFFSIYW